MSHLRRGRAIAFFGLSALTLAMAACELPTQAPTVDGAQFAKGGGGPSVDGAIPAEGAQGTVNLQVRVLGSGFDNGSNAVWLRDGSPAPDVTTNSTSYVSKTELIADITIDVDALETLYDIEVTTRRGKKGVGVELFSVKKEGEVTPYYAISFPDNAEFWNAFSVSDISDADVFAGSYEGSAAVSDASGSVVQLPDFGLGGGIRRISSGASFAVGGDMDPVTYFEQGIVWDLTTRSAHRLTSLPGYPSEDYEGEPQDINDSGLVVGQTITRDTNVEYADRIVIPTLWEPDGLGGWLPRALPLLPGFTKGSALAINGAGDIVGRNQTDAFSSGHAVAWFRNPDGSYDVLDLTPLASGAGEGIAFAITERLVDGTFHAGGSVGYDDDIRAARWTVDPDVRSLREELLAPDRGGVRHFAPSGDMAYAGGGIWDPATNTILEIEKEDPTCNTYGGPFDSAGRIWGRVLYNTRNDGNCGVPGKFLDYKAAVWTKFGG